MSSCASRRWPFHVSNSGAYQGFAVAGMAGQGAVPGVGVALGIVAGLAGKVGTDGCGALAGAVSGVVVGVPALLLSFAATNETSARFGTPYAIAKPSRSGIKITATSFDTTCVNGRRRPRGGSTQRPIRRLRSIASIHVGDGPLAPKQPQLAAPDAISRPRMAQKSVSNEIPMLRAACTGPTTIRSAAAISQAIMKRMAGSR